MSPERQRETEREREKTNLKIQVKNDVLVISGYQTSEYQNGRTFHFHSRWRKLKAIVVPTQITIPTKKASYKIITSLEPIRQLRLQDSKTWTEFQ